jgi:hypothetical protein
MSTNGYEIRLELLKMAKEMMEQDWHAQRDAVMSDYSTKVSLAHGKAESQGFAFTEYPTQPTFKPFPTEEEIIKKAKVLNDFVAQKA